MLTITHCWQCHCNCNNLILKTILYKDVLQQSRQNGALYTKKAVSHNQSPPGTHLTTIGSIGFWGKVLSKAFDYQLHTSYLRFRIRTMVFHIYWILGTGRTSSDYLCVHMVTFWSLRLIDGDNIELLTTAQLLAGFDSLSKSGL